MGDTAGNTAEINASVKQRVMFAVAAAIMAFALWGWSLCPAN